MTVLLHKVDFEGLDFVCGSVKALQNILHTVPLRPVDNSVRRYAYQLYFDFGQGLE